MLPGWRVSLMKRLNSLGMATINSTLPASTQHLAEVRASQINGGPDAASVPGGWVPGRKRLLQEGGCEPVVPLGRRWR
jgi:hypothetical protein